MARPRQAILDNLDAVYREAYGRAKAAGDERRMADLDAAYQREQLWLEVWLDVRDALTVVAAGAGREAGKSGDPVAALETLRRLTRLR